MRLIDGDALKTKFCNHCDERDCKPGATDTVYGCVIADTIDSMPTIEAEPVSGWISVEDRLPENDGLYIVCKTIKPHQIVFEAHWKENKWLSVVKNNQLDYVTHWQYIVLPEK